MLNDDFRCSFQGGRVLLTIGVSALPREDVVRIQNIVRAYDDFTEENDPHQEHDFGSFALNNVTYYWKIDYYDAECQMGSDDPADPGKTTRVLTILRADEY